MNRKRKISGLMSLILLLAMLDGAFSADFKAHAGH